LPSFIATKEIMAITFQQLFFITFSPLNLSRNYAYKTPANCWWFIATLFWLQKQEDKRIPNIKEAWSPSLSGSMQQHLYQQEEEVEQLLISQKTRLCFNSGSAWVHVHYYYSTFPASFEGYFRPLVYFTPYFK
jgi:hypothetical protein